MDIKIREAKKEELPYLYELRQISSDTSIDCYTQEEIEFMRNSYENLDNFLEKIDKDTSIILVATKDNKILGYLFFEIGKNHLWHLFIDPNYMKRGIGSKLLKKLEENLKDKGIREIHSYIRLGVVDFYEKHGFEIIGDDIWDTKGQIEGDILLQEARKIL